jgi:uncharacterized membrane protein
MIFGPTMMLLVTAGIVALIMLLVRSFGYSFLSSAPSRRLSIGDVSYGRRALSILEERFANGEHYAEFRAKRKLLGR